MKQEAYVDDTRAISIRRGFLSLHEERLAYFVFVCPSRAVSQNDSTRKAVRYNRITYLRRVYPNIGGRYYRMIRLRERKNDFAGRPSTERPN